MTETQTIDVKHSIPALHRFVRLAALALALCLAVPALAATEGWAMAAAFASAPIIQ